MKTNGYPGNLIIAGLVWGLILIGLGGIIHLPILQNIGIGFVIFPWCLIVFDIALTIIGLRTIEYYIISILYLIWKKPLFIELKGEL